MFVLNTRAKDVANFEPYPRPFQNDQPNSRLYFRLSTTTRLSATNYLLIDAGQSMDQRQIEKAPDCNRTHPYTVIKEEKGYIKKRYFYKYCPS